MTLGDYIFAKLIGSHYLIYLIYIYPKLIQYYIEILGKIKIINALKLFFGLNITYDNCFISKYYDLFNCIRLLSEVFNIKIERDFIVLNYKNRVLRFVRGEPIRDIVLSLIEQFRLEQYSLDPSLSFDELDVVDVGGAYVGDSAIWFALNGAKHIYALEPYPYAFQMAEINIRLNNIDNVTLINAGVGNVRTQIKVPNIVSNRYSQLLESSSDGVNVPILTLKDLVRTYNIDDALLKMDCEGGCERSILYTDDDTLHRFKYMIIEYDYGYLDLMRRLKEAGFKVKRWKRPRIINDRVTGIIYAIRL